MRPSWALFSHGLYPSLTEDIHVLCVSEDRPWHLPIPAMSLGHPSCFLTDLSASRVLTDQHCFMLPQVSCRSEKLLSSTTVPRIPLANMATGQQCLLSKFWFPLPEYKVPKNYHTIFNILFRKLNNPVLDMSEHSKTSCGVIRLTCR